VRCLRLTVDNGTAVGMDRLSTDGAAVIARQEDKARSNLAGLRRPANRRSELLHRLVVHGRRNERRPHRARRNSVNANALANILVRQTTCERDDCALGRSVIQQIRTADIRIDRRVVDDRRPLLHVRQRVLG
jgi:hypothetical protein